MRIALTSILLGGCVTTFNNQEITRMTALSAIGIIGVAFIFASVAEEEPSDKGFGCKTCSPPMPETLQ